MQRPSYSALTSQRGNWEKGPRWKNVRLQILCSKVLQKRFDVKFTSQSMINKKRVVEPFIVFCEKNAKQL